MPFLTRACTAFSALGSLRTDCKESSQLDSEGLQVSFMFESVLVSN